MKAGLPMGPTNGPRIDYKTPRRFNAEAARRAVIECLDKFLKYKSLLMNHMKIMILSSS